MPCCRGIKCLTSQKMLWCSTSLVVLAVTEKVLKDIFRQVFKERFLQPTVHESTTMTKYVNINCFNLTFSKRILNIAVLKCFCYWRNWNHNCTWSTHIRWLMQHATHATHQKYTLTGIELFIVISHHYNSKAEYAIMASLVSQ